MESVAEDSELWAKMNYLATKMEADKKAGKGFMRRLVTSDFPKIGAIRREYMKRRSTEPMIQHPTDPELCRLLTVREHALAKRIPESMVEDRPGQVARTPLHEMFGQGVVFSVFERVAYHIAKAFVPVAQNDDLYKSAGYVAERGTCSFAA